eukprot:s16630_g1.t1
MDAIGMNWIVARLLCEDGSTTEAIKNEKPNRVNCDADEIDIYSQQESISRQI